MTHRITALLVTAACAWAIAPVALAQTAPGGAAAQSPPASQAPVAGQPPADAAAPDPSMPADRFLAWVAAGGALQLELGSLAAHRSASPDVRDLARRMVTNHTAIQVIAGNIAKAEGMELPTAPDGADRALLERVRMLEGEAFDQAYMMFLAERSAWVLTCFRWQSEHCTHERIKPFVSGTAPIMGTHARLAEALNADINKEALRLAAERKEEERKLAEQKRAVDAAAAAAAAARKPAPKRSRSLGGAQ